MAITIEQLNKISKELYGDDYLSLDKFDKFNILNLIC